jgi:hypothetical protein
VIESCRDHKAGNVGMAREYLRLNYNLAVRDAHSPGRLMNKRGGM